MIPGARLSFPRQIVRVSFGRRRQVDKDGRKVWTTERLDHLFLAKLADRKTIGGRRQARSGEDAGEPQYRQDPRLMEALREEHRKADCHEHCCKGLSGDLADWKPAWVPIYVIGPPEWWWQEGIQADLGAKWVCRCEGPWTIKTDEQIDADAEALDRRGLPAELAKGLSAARRAENVLLQTGVAQRRDVTQAQKGDYEVKLVGTPRAVECNPARCPHWWKRNRKRGEIACEETATLTFLLPFLSGAEQWGFWRTRGKASINRMRSTIATAIGQAGGDLTFVPLRLNLTVEPVLTPTGEHQNQPIGHIALHAKPEQMAQLIEWRGQQKLSSLAGYIGEDGMPQLNPANLPDVHERAMLPEWNPNAPEDRRPWQARAWEAGLEAKIPEAQVGVWVGECESEEAFLGKLSEWLQAQGPQDRDAAPAGDGGEAEEEPIDADFTPPEEELAAGAPSVTAQLTAQFTDIAESHSWSKTVVAALKTSAGIGSGNATEEQAQKLVALATAKAKADQKGAPVDA